MPEQLSDRCFRFLKLLNSPYKPVEETTLPKEFQDGNFLVYCWHMGWIGRGLGEQFIDAKTGPMAKGDVVYLKSEGLAAYMDYEAAIAEQKPEPHARALRKRRQRESQQKGLTPKQVEAMQIVGEHKGNIMAAAKALGRDPKTIRDHYEAARRKLGVVQHANPKTKRLPEDRRGQPNVSRDRRTD